MRKVRVVMAGLAAVAMSAVTVAVAIAGCSGGQAGEGADAQAEEVDSYSPDLYWQHPVLGVFDLVAGENTLEVVAIEPNPAASPGNLFGLDYVFLTRQE
jgi:hypothetical protein